MRFEQRIDIAFQATRVPATKDDTFHDRNVEPGQPERCREVEISSSHFCSRPPLW